MKLHIDNLLLSTDATDEEMPLLKRHLHEWLHLNKRVSLNNAHEILAHIRQAPSAV